MISPMTTASAADIAQAIAKQTESLILEQLNDFVSRGLIKIELGPTSFVQAPEERNRIKIVQTCRLVLNDKDYIEKLEKENKDFKELIMRLRAAM